MISRFEKVNAKVLKIKAKHAQRFKISIILMLSERFHLHLSKGSL